MLPAMKVLRSILTALLVVAFAGYGVTANAPAHAHVAEDFHAVHVIAVDTHHVSHDAPVTDHGAPTHGDEETLALDVSGTGDDETGLHAHCAPHFNEADATIVLIAAELSAAVRTLVLSTLPALQRAAPPFKPPRSIL